MSDFMAGLLAVAVIFLLLVLFFNVDSLQKILKARRVSAQEKHQVGFADHLCYACEPENGIILCKNGALMAAWEYECADTDALSDEENDLLSERINTALKVLGTGWMINVDAVRVPASGYPRAADSHFPDEVCFAIDEERRRHFAEAGNAFVTKNVLTATFLPPLAAISKITDMMFKDDAADKSGKKEKTEKILAKFKSDISSLEQRLSIAFKMRRLRCRKEEDEDGKIHYKDEFLSFLFKCITGKDSEIELPPAAMYLDQVIGSHEFWATVTPQIDDMHVAAIAIDGFPQASVPGILNVLAQLPTEYRWSTRFVPMDSFEAENRLNETRRLWQQKTRGFMQQMFNIGPDKINLDAVNQVADADEALADLQSGACSFGYYTSNIILYDPSIDYLRRMSNAVQREILRLGFSARIETVNAPQAFMGSLPGMRNNVRHPLMATNNLSDMLPTITVWSGQDKCPCGFYPDNSPALMRCVTVGSTPFNLNLHVRDLGHAFVFGPTGSGKSTLLATLAAQFRRYRGMKLFCFDKGYSMFALTKACGGAHFDVAGDDSALAFMPLSEIAAGSAGFAWCADWICDLLQLNGVVPTPAQRNLITSALSAMKNTESHTFSDFVNSVQDNSIREALEAYAVGGQMGRLFDATEDGLSMTDFMTFELEDLMNLPDRFKMPVLTYLFRRIEKTLDGSPAAIILDEAWLMLANPVFREKIREWLKVLRKANCAVVMATQSLSDAANSGILDVITESTATKIFLANPYASDDANMHLYRSMGLNKRQIQEISRMIPKREYYCASELGHRLFELELGPLALAFVGASDKESIARMKSLIESEGEAWHRAWLAEKNIDINDYLRSNPQ